MSEVKLEMPQGVKDVVREMRIQGLGLINLARQLENQFCSCPECVPEKMPCFCEQKSCTTAK